MLLKDAIKYAIDGKAVLFIGSGFSYGAFNQNNEEMSGVARLCEKLSNEAGIEYDKSDNDLGYISDKYIDNVSKESLVNNLKKEFTTKSHSPQQEEVINLNWKRIYTTNYDDIVEKASDKLGLNRNTLTLSKDTDISQIDNSIIHLNGYIKDLNIYQLDNEFKLTKGSYLQEDFYMSSWISLFREDVKSQKAIIFIGYSLNFDLDIQRVLVQVDNLREKSFFICHHDEKAKSVDIMSKFGTVEKIGLNGFSDLVNEVKNNYEKVEEAIDNFKNFRYYNNYEFIDRKIKDKDIFNLFIDGSFNLNFINNSRYGAKYSIQREDTKKIISALENDNNLIIIHSDLGNGKTGTIHELIPYLIDKGHVFQLINKDEDFFIEYERLIKYKGQKYILIDDYQVYLNQLKLMEFTSNEIKYILTARSLLNDVNYLQLIDRMNIDEDKVRLFNVNQLTYNDVDEFIDIIDEYHLWGDFSNYNPKEKGKLINRRYKRKFQNILAGFLNSSQIKNRLDNIIEIINENKHSKEIILLSFINSILNTNLSLDDIIYLLDITSISAKLERNTHIGELINIQQNKIYVKSSILANYMLKEYDFSNAVIDILIKIMKNADKMNYMQKYNTLMRSLVSFSVIRLVINEKGEKLANLMIKYYENIKNLEFNKKSTHFWLQYAIARIEVKHYIEAETYFKNAYAHANNRHFDTYQIDTHYARFLMEKQLYLPDYNSPFDSFEKAHNFIINNRNKPENWHYPLRHVNLYSEYYYKFWDKFNDFQKGMFLLKCKEIINKIREYNTKVTTLGREKHRNVVEGEKKLKIVIKNIELGV